MKKMTFDPSKLETPVTVLFDSSNAVSTHEIRFLKSPVRRQLLPGSYIRLRCPEGRFAGT